MRKIFLIIICIIVIIFLGRRIPGEWQKHQLLTEEVESLENKKENLTQEQQRLEEFLETGTQEEILEREVRSMLGYKKEGEQVILVVPIINNEENFEIATNSDFDILVTSNTNDNLVSKLSLFWQSLLKRVGIKK